MVPWPVMMSAWLLARGNKGCLRANRLHHITSAAAKQSTYITYIWYRLPITQCIYVQLYWTIWNKTNGCSVQQCHCRLRPQNGQKSLWSMGYRLEYVKIDQSQNQDLSTSIERLYKELLNALFSFDTWVMGSQKRDSKWQKNHFALFANSSIVCTVILHLFIWSTESDHAP